MAHIHSVHDTDLHFKIDPITRTITNMAHQKVMLVQNDHNSERFTFELPRIVEGHDMSTCIEIKDPHTIYYIIDDTTLDDIYARITSLLNVIFSRFRPNRPFYC